MTALFKRLAVFVLLFVAARSAVADPADTVRDAYRHFIMPTARPIDGGYFGFWELGFLQGGGGLGAISLSGGVTVLPTVAFRSQIAFLQGKLTLYDDRNLGLAAGVNWLRLTSDYPYTHIFAVMTIETNDQSRYSGAIFYKASGDDFPHPDIEPYGAFQFSYGGALGVSLGMDMPIASSNMRFVAEAWNHDLSVPNKLAVLGALRLEAEDFSSDFGFMYFTLPLIVPVANFVWRF
jgi:hypothetical protein